MRAPGQLQLVPDPDGQDRKSRGAFFTPRVMADFMAEWAIRQADDRIIEPSCGEAVFLTAATAELRTHGAEGRLDRQLFGLDIHEESIALARRVLAEDGESASLQVANFFDVDAPERGFDVVLGNPPYVRYQNFTGEAREKALQAARLQGVDLPGLASSWAAFTVHAASFAAPSGRLALVLPGELLSVNYAAPVRRFLMQRFGEVRLIVFEERVFPGVAEEVVLLLAEGEGPTDTCHLFQARNLDDLGSLHQTTWVPADTAEKWTVGLVPTGAYTEAIEEATFAGLQEWGETTLGMVTGNNKYFTLTAGEVRDLRLDASDLVKLSPPGSKHLRGLTFTERMWREMLRDGSRCYLFDAHPVRPSEQAMRYIRSGEKKGVHRAYKCRVRTPWWVVPKVAVPDLFLTYMNHDAPRMVANRARVAYLNSVHGVTLRDGLRQLGMDLLPIAMLNSLTLLGAELVGRAYGGGVLKIEPREADKLPVPAAEVVRAAADGLRALRPQLARHLRNSNLDAVVELVDKVLLRQHLKMGREAVLQLRAARDHLFNRRARRGRA